MNTLYENAKRCRARGMVAFLLLLPRGPAIAADLQPIDFQAFSQETQILHKNGSSMKMVLWFPIQYWEILSAADKRLTERQKKDLVEAFRPYIIIDVVDAKLSAIGGPSFKGEADIRANIQLVDAKGNAYRPLGEDDVQVRTRSLLAAMRPSLTATLGPMGKNMYTVVFRGTDSNGQLIADPRSKGQLVVKLGDDEFRWKLPLGSVLPAKQCPKCKETCSGAWDFCPWCGVKLLSAP